MVRRKSTWQRVPRGGWTWGRCYVRPVGFQTTRVGGRLVKRPWFWLYVDGGRYSPTGRFADSVGFPARRAAQDYAEALMARQWSGTR